MTFDLVALKDEQAAARSARPRRSLDLETESFVRVLPIRWRLLSIAALNATVAVILATLDLERRQRSEPRLGRRAQGA